MKKLRLFAFVVFTITYLLAISPGTVLAAEEVVAGDKLEITARSAKISTTVGGLYALGGGTFLFIVELKYSGANPRSFDLKLDGPENWSALITLPGTFIPSDPQTGAPSTMPEIGLLNVSLKPGETASIDVVAAPPEQPQPNIGEYKLKLAASSGGVEAASIDLFATISGTYGMQFVPINGLLNMKADPGKQNLFAMKLDNLGASSIDNIKFYSQRTEGWQVGVAPGEIDSISGHNSEMLTIIIIPSEDTLVGDYHVVLYAYGNQSGAVTDIRVTVNPPIIWGWIGLIGVVVFIGGLVFVYSRFRRR
jgi:uncharacterized membrane protein